jgi:hypothetical protein
VLQRARTERSLRDAPLRELLAESIDAGALDYYAPYETVHRENLETVLGAS